MLHKKYVKRRAEAASALLSGKTFSAQSLEAVATVLRGIDPTIDESLDRCTVAFADLKTHEKSSIVELTEADTVPGSDMPPELKSSRLRCIHAWRDLKSHISQIATESTGDISPWSIELLRFGRQLRQPSGIVGAAVFLAAMGILINLYTAQIPTLPQPENGQVKGLIKESTSEATLAPSPLK